MADILKMTDIRKCPTQFGLALKDALNVLNGKWKMAIIGTLLFGKKRFSELEREIKGINPRMLSKELKELELNGVVSRRVIASRPVSIEYELTESGISLKKVLEEMIKWGLQHRERVFKKQV